MKLSRFVSNYRRFFFQAILWRFLAGWVLLAPWALLIPKKRKLLLLIGKDGGLFADSIKYFFLYLTKLPEVRFEFFLITERRDVYRSLGDSGMPVLFFPSWKAVWKLLRCSTLVVDNKNWIRKFKYHLTLRSRKVQIWHGVPLKKIGLTNEFELEARRFFWMRFYHFTNGLYPFYRLLQSPSEYFSRTCFRDSFKAGEILVNNYPRNDIFFRDIEQGDLIGAQPGFFDEMVRMRSSHKRICLYLPTFRDNGGNAFKDGILKADSLSAFCQEYNLIWITKFHSWEGEGAGHANEAPLFFLDKESDIYPYLKICDLLITDYSSVCFDYLLLEKPLIFFSYDLERYRSRDRQLYFEYRDFICGLQASSQEELQQALRTLAEDPSRDLEFASRRAEILKKSFDFRNGHSSERLYKRIAEMA